MSRRTEGRGEVCDIGQVVKDERKSSRQRAVGQRLR